MLPYLSGLMGVSCLALLTPLAKRFQLDFPPFAFVAITSSMMALGGFVLSFCTERGFSAAKLPGSAWMNILLFSVINFIGLVFYLRAVGRLPANTYQLLYLLSPVIVAVASYFILSERIDMRQVLGFLIVALGLGVALYPKG